MSKTIAELAQILAASNEQLFDRYINVRLTKDRPLLIDLGIADKPTAKTGFQIITPKSGCKPKITVSGKIIPAETVCAITLTIYNILDNVDTMAYNWAEVEVGYMNSNTHMTFVGEIINCYMAKPNPNGELVISITTADVANLYANGDFEVEFLEDIVSTSKLITTCLDAIIKAHPDLKESIDKAELVSKIPEYWQFKNFAVGKATRRFRSAFECITWLNSLFASLPFSTGYAASSGGASISNAEEKTRGKLTPLRLGFDNQSNLTVTTTYSEVNPTTVKAITAIGSAVLTSSSSATVTAPFNPGLTPGEVIYLDSQYFKTRINTEAVRPYYATKGNLWYIRTMEFVFSTYDTNMMTLGLNNLNNIIVAQEG